jgi:hypothetical protein
LADDLEIIVVNIIICFLVIVEEIVSSILLRSLLVDSVGEKESEVRIQEGM